MQHQVNAGHLRGETPRSGSVYSTRRRAVGFCSIVIGLGLVSAGMWGCGGGSGDSGTDQGSTAGGTTSTTPSPAKSTTTPAATTAGTAGGTTSGQAGNTATYTSASSDLAKEKPEDQAAFVPFSFDYPSDWTVTKAPGGGSYVDVETPKGNTSGYLEFSALPMSGNDTKGATQATYEKVLQSIAAKMGGKADTPATQVTLGSMKGYEEVFAIDPAKADFPGVSKSDLTTLAANGMKPLAGFVIVPADMNGQKNGLMLMMITLNSDVKTPDQVGTVGGLKTIADSLKFGGGGAGSTTTPASSSTPGTDNGATAGGAGTDNGATAGGAGTAGGGTTQ